jgi:hypothetical protein
VASKIISQFATLSEGDVNKLMDMYSTFNFCSNMTRGMDACDKVSKLLQCGKDNSPDAVSGLMNNLEATITVRCAQFPALSETFPTCRKLRS